MSVFDTFLNWTVFVQTLPLAAVGPVDHHRPRRSRRSSSGSPAAWCWRCCGSTRRRRCAALAIAYIDVFRAIPLLVLLIVIYYALPFVGLRLSPFASAATALSLVSAAYSAEILRAGIEGVPRGQFEAARALGLGLVRQMTRRRPAAGGQARHPADHLQLPST